MAVQRASPDTSGTPAPSPSPACAGAQGRSFASDVALALLAGLADLPCGPERAKACVSRRLELRGVLRQVRRVLDETEGAAGADAEGGELCAGRLAWALQTTAGLQEAAAALRLLEQADLLCDSVVPSAPLRMAYGPRRGPLRSALPAAVCRELPGALAQEHRAVVAELDECKQRIADLAPAFGCGDTLPQHWPAPRRAPQGGSEFWEGFQELVAMNAGDLGRTFYPVAKIAGLLRPFLALLLESPGPLELTVVRSLPRGVPKPRSPFP